MSARVLLVGAGGLGCPVAEILARSGPTLPATRLTILDDDLVDGTNLHRQLLYDVADVGAPKADTMAAKVRWLAATHRTPLEVVPVAARLVPEDALARVRESDLVVEGTDNLASKFLAADAAHLAQRPIVHAGVVRWTGWAKAVHPGTSACLRCLFEDLPEGRVETCAEAGVVGPLVGVVGALAAGLVLRVLRGEASVGATWTRVDAKLGIARTVPVRRRSGCSLCGPAAALAELSAERYAPRCLGVPLSSGVVMSIKVRIPTPLRTLTQGQDEVLGEGATVRAVLDDLERRHPGLKDRICDEKGVRRFVNVFLNEEEDIRFLDGLDTALKAGDALQIVPAIAGGR